MISDMKFGRRTPKQTPSLRLASILKTTIPDHPLSEDYLANLKDWKVLGNDQHGVCAAVGWANNRKFISSMLGEKENYPGLDEVLQLYKTQNPGFPYQDDGMELQGMLEYLNKNGGPDGVKLVAFASVNTYNIEEVKAAIHIFGSLLLGVEVQGKNQEEFAEGKPWDYHAGNPILGGHCVLSGGYRGETNDDVRFITWGDETGMTKNFWNNLVSCRGGEAWVLLWPENFGTKQFAEGIDLNALATNYQILTGRVLPIPAPAPSLPTPQPEKTSWIVQFLNWIISLLMKQS